MLHIDLARLYLLHKTLWVDYEVQTGQCELKISYTCTGSDLGNNQIRSQVLSRDPVSSFVPGSGLKFCPWIRSQVLSLDPVSSFVPGSGLKLCPGIRSQVLSRDPVSSFVPGSRCRFLKPLYLQNPPQTNIYPRTQGVLISSSMDSKSFSHQIQSSTSTSVLIYTCLLHSIVTIKGLCVKYLSYNQ